MLTFCINCMLRLPYFNPYAEKNEKKRLKYYMSLMDNGI